MLLISYAIVYRMNILKKENKVMREAIFEYVQKINDLKSTENQKNITIKESIFSEQELQIIKAISIGLSNKEIAAQMFISVNTVKYHTKKIYNKLQVESRKDIQDQKIQFS